MRFVNVKNLGVSLAVSFGLLAVSTPAHAVQTTTSPAPGVPDTNCAWATAVVSQSGNDLQVTAYAWGQAWNNGACNGISTPEKSVQMEAILYKWDFSVGGARQCKNFTPPGQPGTFGAFVFNTLDAFGIYFASIPGGGLLSNGAAGAIVPYSQLCGPGYYQLGVSSYVQNNPADPTIGWRGGAINTPWQYMTIPSP